MIQWIQSREFHSYSEQFWSCTVKKEVNYHLTRNQMWARDLHTPISKDHSMKIRSHFCSQEPGSVFGQVDQMTWLRLPVASFITKNTNILSHLLQTFSSYLVMSNILPNKSFGFWWIYILNHLSIYKISFVWELWLRSIWASCKVESL
jgi:hypothetical protein